MSLIVIIEVVNGRITILFGGFSYSALMMLVFFVFINFLVGGAVLIESWRLGILVWVLVSFVFFVFIIGGEMFIYLIVSLG